MAKSLSPTRHMQLREHEFTEQALRQFGEELVRLLKASDFAAVAHKFGYDKDFEIEAEVGIREQLESTLEYVESNRAHIPLRPNDSPGVTVEFASSNPFEVLGNVLCPFEYSDGVWVQAVLRIDGNAQGRYLTFMCITEWPEIPDMNPEWDP